MNFARHNGVVKFPLAIAAAMLLLCGCGTKPATSMERTPAPAPDPHSYANSNEVRVEHADLDLDVSFDNRQFSGTATLSLKPVGSAMPGKLILDTRDLTVKQVESGDGTRFAPAKFDVGKADKVFGAPLTIQLAPTDKQVRITYTTSPSASGLLWLNPEQTAGKKHPFVFSQGQPIHTRSWVPIQDTPDVRFTYNAHVRTPKELLAVMSAENDPHPKTRGDYRFRMPQAIPSYLMAIAVGDLEFASLGQRSGVYAEPSVVKKAAHELEDTEKMIAAAESLYGPYRWGRYDLLILPPSFPFGGMENPRLTFATPTILAGDKSLVALVSHELAHSWSGNLVTNAT
ncbi:MAG TPA: M1 family aminopeptidase/hydrolase, partial [Bryobacteraceae bacterium]|nr:M1 family aminopeptidase/hydrolase [Bryobacteraceae bacterium]